MSRVGKGLIKIPDGVDCCIKDGFFHSKGPKGELKVSICLGIKVEIDGKSIVVKPDSDNKHTNMLWGTMQRLVNNSVLGVSKGFSKKLEMTGVGYRAQLKGDKLVLQLGFSHDIEINVPVDIKVVCEKPTIISIHGMDKQKVGEFAANIRKYRLPEPYKGKGIKYEGEFILRKEGKRK